MSLLIHTLHVDLGERSYPVYIGRDLLSDSQLLTRHLSGKQLVLVSNNTVAPIYLDKVRQAVGSDRQVCEVIVEDGEEHKTLATLSTILDRVMAARHSRNTTFVAVGGGVIGDLTGFAAACYQRGVNFIQVPTTLLAQVDSSVGGKTGVNHPLGKNMIGAFHQPQAVVIDIQTLRTLPPREFSAGLAEVVKYGLICDAPFYQWLDHNCERIMAREEAALAEAIERSCANKARVVAADEREGGLRAILNLGHTFGHAIETAQGYGNWLHGEAVAAGMVLAARLSAQRSYLGAEEVANVSRLLGKMGLPCSPPEDMDADTFIDLMGRDKKAIDGRLRFILLADIGDARIVDDVTESELRQLLQPR